MTEIVCARAGFPLRPQTRNRTRLWVNPSTRVSRKTTRRAVFLDRDGVLNKDSGYAVHPYAIRFCHRVLPLIRQLRRRGYLVIVVTNQSGLERGMFTTHDFLRCTQYMLRHLRQRGIEIDALYYCPSLRDADPYRKPGPGMLWAAARRYQIDVKHSLLIGDRMTDILAGKRAGVGHCMLLSCQRGRLSLPRLTNHKFAKGGIAP